MRVAEVDKRKGLRLEAIGCELEPLAPISAIPDAIAVGRGGFEVAELHAMKYGFVDIGRETLGSRGNGAGERSEFRAGGGLGDFCARVGNLRRGPPSHGLSRFGVVGPRQDNAVGNQAWGVSFLGKQDTLLLDVVMTFVGRQSGRSDCGDHPDTETKR